MAINIVVSFNNHYIYLKPKLIKIARLNYVNAYMLGVI